MPRRPPSCYDRFHVLRQLNDAMDTVGPALDNGVCREHDGCLLMAALVVYANILPALQLEGVLAVSRHYAEATAIQHIAWGIPAGFLIASLVWILPRMEGAGEVLVIVIVTYMIGVGGLSHVVAGSTELFVLVLRGELSAWSAIAGGIAPALLGNVIGGTFTFSALTYAQIKRDGWPQLFVVPSNSAVAWNGSLKD